MVLRVHAETLILQQPPFRSQHAKQEVENVREKVIKIKVNTLFSFICVGGGYIK